MYGAWPDSGPVLSTADFSQFSVVFGSSKLDLHSLGPAEAVAESS